VLAAGIVLAGLLYSRRFEKHHRETVERQLSAIAELKAGDLAQWRKERLGDGAVFLRNANFSGLVRRLLDNPGDADAEARIQNWLAQIRAAHGYDRVCLHDAAGIELISVPETGQSHAAGFLQSASETLESGKIALADFNRNEQDNRVYLKS
jgi:hypothetical protein